MRSRTRTYDADYRLTGIEDSGTATAQNLTLAYNANDNLTGVTDHVTSGNSQTLAYDALDRLHTASGGYGSQTFGYDANGNRSSLNGTSWTYTANSNRLTAMGTTSVSTNANGSITGVAASPTMGFTFYKSGRLDTVTSGSGTVLTYTYDAFGRRATKVDTAQRFYQYAFDDKVLEESDNTYTTKLDTIYLGGMPVATFVPNGSTGTLSFLHTGKNDIPRVATNASQTTGWSFTTADPFAGGTATVSTISNDLRYPGQEYEMATGQFYNRNRDYAPGWGRYLESDPIGLNGGQTSTYAYAGSNPARFIDPSGLDGFVSSGRPLLCAVLLLCGSSNEQAAQPAATHQEQPAGQTDEQKVAKAFADMNSESDSELRENQEKVLNDICPIPENEADKDRTLRRVLRLVRAVDKVLGLVFPESKFVDPLIPIMPVVPKNGQGPTGSPAA